MSRTTNIDLELLRTFIRVVETGSFAGAARIVGRTQSAVSMQIQRLEDQLGHSLFARGRGHAPGLTPQGSFLVQRARELLALNDAIWDEFNDPTLRDRAYFDVHTSSHRVQRETFTNQVMVTLLTNEKFSTAYAQIMGHVERGELIEPSSLSARDEDLYMALLSMLEYIAINFLAETMDRTIILRQRRSGLWKVHEALAGYIAIKRQAWGRPSVYRSFEILAENYLADPSDTRGPGSCTDVAGSSTLQPTAAD